MDEYSDYWDEPIAYEDEFDKPESSFYQTYKFCLEPTLYEVFPHIWKLLAINFIFRIGTQTRIFPKNYNNIFSTICGIAVLYFILRSSLIYVIVFVIFCYISLQITQYLREYWAFSLSLLCILYLIISEFYFPLPQAWSETRGLHMIFAMKVISIAFDIKKGSLKCLPDTLEYLGYMLCPSNCLFGPWISLNTYKTVFTSQTSILDLSWAKHIILSAFLAIVFLTLSNCWAYWLIPQTWSWFVAYQEGLSFRSSHYFISYLSEAAMVTGGFTYGNGKKRKDSPWSFVVTHPMSMELPRSLVQVVVHWNLPMHMWLKNYVFQVCRPFGSFSAVIMTYFVSSFLHGFNLKLAAVLLSLGFYTYIEYKLRYKFSVIFDACVAANPCKKCDHTYQSTNVYVWVANAAFSILVMFHLAYLGCLLESTAYMYDNETESFSKWQQLDFASHIVTVFLYLVYKLI